MFSEEYIARVRARALAAIQNHHEQPWIPAFKKTVEQFIATMPLEQLQGFCLLCNSGRCGHCGKCHTMKGEGVKCKAFEREKVGCWEWREAFGAIKAIIYEDGLW